MRTILSSLSRAAMPRASAYGYTVDNVDQRAVVLHAMFSGAIVEWRCFWVRLCVSLEFNSRMTAWILPDDDVMGCTNALMPVLVTSSRVQSSSIVGRVLDLMYDSNVDLCATMSPPMIYNPV